MPWHTAPEFRQMLLDLADGQIEVAPVLADWMEERDDERAERVRLFARLRVMEYNDGGVLYWYLGATCTAGALLLLATTPAVTRHLTPDRARNELAMLILQLFPEGPRRQTAFREFSRDGYLSEQQAQESHPGRIYRVTGYYWPSPPPGTPLKRSPDGTYRVARDGERADAEMA